VVKFFFVIWADLSHKSARQRVWHFGGKIDKFLLYKEREREIQNSP